MYLEQGQELPVLLKREQELLVPLAHLKQAQEPLA